MVDSASPYKEGQVLTTMTRTILATLLLAACTGGSDPSPGPNTPPDPNQPGPITTSLSLNVVPDSALPGSVVVAKAQMTKVQDGKTLTTGLNGTPITFVVTKGNGSVFAAVVLTDGLGQAGQQWTVSDSGWNVLEARMVDTSGGAMLVGKDSVFVDPPPQPVWIPTVFSTFPAVVPADTPIDLTQYFHIFLVDSLTGTIGQEQPWSFDTWLQDPNVNSKCFGVDRPDSFTVSCAAADWFIRVSDDPRAICETPRCLILPFKAE